MTFNKITIKHFFEEELVDYASYSTLRAIASLVDGQKNSSRKLIHTIQKKNITSKYKVQNLASLVSMETEYLHGGVSLEGVIVTTARKFIGTNNLNVLYPSGNFGTRFEPEASASRYIFTYKEPIFDKLFNKEDNNVLLKQNFEGTEIEPRFFVPTLPLILINGSTGIATGFAQKILPRKISDIKKYITAYNKNPNAKKFPNIEPYYEGFNGIIEKGAKDNQWNIKGTFEKVQRNKIIITELPIGYDLKQYTKVLDILEDNKTIRSYKDLSDSKNDIFKFEVSVTSDFFNLDDESIISKLKLIKSVTENFTVINENNRIEVYNSAEEVLNHYIKVKMDYLQKRKDYMVSKIKQDILETASKYLFVKNITDGKIIVNNKKKQEIEEQIIPIKNIIKKDGSYDYLLRMPIYSLTEEKLKDIYNDITKLKVYLDETTNKSISSIWIDEIKEIK